MPRILAIDYGTRRVGLAVTDVLQIIATPLETIDANLVLPFLIKYLKENEVEALVLGMPKSLDGSNTNNTKPVREFGRKLQSACPGLPIFLQDERFTSIIAQQSMLAAGLGKKARANKATTDRTSAVLILQGFLENRGNGFPPTRFQ